MKPLNNLCIHFLLLACLLLVGAGCSDTGKNESIEAKSPSDQVALSREQFEQMEWKLGTIQSSNRSHAIHVTGYVDVPPQYKATVHTVYEGNVVYIRLLEGEYVKKGQLLVTLAHPALIELQEDYISLRERLEVAQQDYKRQQMLADEQINAAKKLQEARREYEVTRVQLDATREKIKLAGISLARLEKGEIQSFARIYAPLSGYVSEIMVNKGDYVDASAPLLRLQSMEHLHIELQVFEQDIGKIHVGQPLEVWQPSRPDMKYTGEVYVVGRSVNQDASVRVHAHLTKGTDHLLLPGMYVEADVYTDSLTSPVIPYESVFDNTGVPTVWMLDKETDDSLFFSMKKINPVAIDNDVYIIEASDSSEFLNKKILLEGTDFIRPE